MFFVPFEKSYLCGTVTIAGEELHNLGLCPAFMASEQGRIFIVPHRLWHRTSVIAASSVLFSFHLRQERITARKGYWGSRLLCPSPLRDECLVNHNTKDRMCDRYLVSDSDKVACLSVVHIKDGHGLWRSPEYQRPEIDFLSD